MSLLVLAGWITLLTGCQQLPQHAIQQIEQARGELQKRNYVRCEQILNPVIASYQTSDDIAEALYMRGQCRLMKNQRKQGVRDLATAQNIAKEKRLRAWIEVQLANVAFDDGSPKKARRLYESALGELPDSPPTDQVMHQLALACERTGDRTEARKVRAELATRFPTSTYVAKRGANRSRMLASTQPTSRGRATSAARTTTRSRPRVTRSSTVGSKGRFEIQCGAYAKIDHAHQAAARLRQKGINALAIPQPRGGVVKYVVRVGKYDNYRDASRMLAKVRKFHADAFIVK